MERGKRSKAFCSSCRVNTRLSVTIIVVQASPSSRPAYHFSDTFSALRHPNFRLWFFGQLFTTIGMWVQSTAQGYLIYDITQSAQFLGLVGFVNGLPSWALTIFGGAIADRLPRRTLILITTCISMTMTMVIAILVFTRTIQPWHILILAVIGGMVWAIDGPTRMAFISDLVEKEDLANAIALNSTMFNTATVIGPAVSGVVYALVGPGWCFALNGISYLSVLFVLLRMRLTPRPPRPRTGSIWREMGIGLRYTFSNDMIRTLTINLGLVSMFGFGMLTLLPPWSVKVLGGDVSTNGWLLSARGVGSLIGAFIVAATSAMRIKGRLWSAGLLTLPLMIILFSFTRSLPLSMITLVGLGWALLTLGNTSNALVQENTPDELRGRVMGVYMLTFQGFMPLGNLLAGVMAERLTEPITMLIGGVILAVPALLIFFRKPHFRRLG
ncbi:MAG TPA: MFS transporter [Anaerolineaceae bacterium]